MPVPVLELLSGVPGLDRVMPLKSALAAVAAVACGWCSWPANSAKGLGRGLGGVTSQLLSVWAEASLGVVRAEFRAAALLGCWFARSCARCL